MFVVAGAVWLADHFIVGIKVTSFWPTAVIVAIVLGLLSFFIKPIISFFTFPITVLTLGLFNFVINALIFWLAGSGIFISGFGVSGFIPALLGSIFVSVANLLVDSLMED
jgi:putative membrane protein